MVFVMVLLMIEVVIIIISLAQNLKGELIKTEP